MKLKRTIQIIQYSNGALIIGLFIGVFALISSAKEGKFFFFEMLFSVPFVLAFFFRKAIINIFLKKTLYPAVFYSVLEKLDLTREFELSFTEDFMNEIYKPSYSTDQFLNDNNLKTEIGIKKIKLPIITLAIGLGIMGLWYCGIKYPKQPIALITPLLFIATNVFLWFKGKKQQNDNEPIAFFKPTVLKLPNIELDWKDIYDWNYSADRNNDFININYYDSNKNIQEAIANISQLNIDRIDFLLLLTHFKGKYGQIVTQPN